MTNPPSDALIQMINVDKFFGSFQALTKINLEVKRGEKNRHLRPVGIRQINPDPLYQPAGRTQCRPDHHRWQ